MVYDEKLAGRIRKSLKHKKGVTEKKMFGGIAFLLDGKMFCGVLKNDLIVRTGPEHYEKALTKPHARPFDFSGRPMRGFLYVGPNGCKTEKILWEWIDLGIEYLTLLRKKEK